MITKAPAIGTDAAASDARRKVRFRIGLAFIAASYPVSAASLVFAGMKLRNDGIPWLKFAFAALVLNWILFGLGILIAGWEAAGYFNRRARSWLRRPERIRLRGTSSHADNQPPTR